MTGTPSWHGSKIAYASYDVATADTDIWVMNDDGSNPVDVTNDADVELEPDWSADGTKIAYRVAQAFVPSQVWSMDADGSNRVDLSSNGVCPRHVALLVGRRRPDRVPQVHQAESTAPSGDHSMNADGMEPMNLTEDGTLTHSSPDWSPNGEKIAFTRSDEATANDIWVMDADGSGETELTNTPVAELDPDWSPDGTKIA